MKSRRHYYLLASRGNVEFVLRVEESELETVFDKLHDRMYTLEPISASFYTAQLVKNHKKYRGLKTYDIGFGAGKTFNPGP